METHNQSVMKWQRGGNAIIGTVFATTMLDSLVVTDFGQEVIKVIGKFPKHHLLLNFENVEFLSSAALTELIRINDAAQKNLCIVKLCGVSKDIQKVFRLTKLDCLLPIDNDDVKTVIAKFRKSAERAIQEAEWQEREQQRSRR